MSDVNFKSLANLSVRELTPYQPGKPIEELERELGITSSIKLASNENPLGPSSKAMQAVQSLLPQTHIYPDGGCYEIKHKLANFLSVDVSQLTIGNGSENILELLVKAYLHRGDNAVISQYAFLTIPILIASYGATIKAAPEKNYRHDIARMIELIDEKTRVLFLVNPNNPTGTYTTEHEFKQLLQTVPPHVLIVVDEAYSEYINKPDYPDTLSYLAQYPNLVITRTFSKIYGLAALRLGYAVSSPDIADILNRARLPFNVNALAAKAGAAALDDQAHVTASVELNNAGMRQMTDGLHQLNLPFIPSIANFVTVDVGDGSAVYQKLLHHGVIVRPLKAYDMPRHIRVTIGTAQQNERFLHALQQVIC